MSESISKVSVGSWSLTWPDDSSLTPDQRKAFEAKLAQRLPQGFTMNASEEDSLRLMRGEELQFNGFSIKVVGEVEITDERVIAERLSEEAAAARDNSTRGEC